MDYLSSGQAPSPPSNHRERERANAKAFVRTTVDVDEDGGRGGGDDRLGHGAVGAARRREVNISRQIQSASLATGRLGDRERPGRSPL